MYIHIENNACDNLIKSLTIHEMYGSECLRPTAILKNLFDYRQFHQQLEIKQYCSKFSNLIYFKRIFHLIRI